MIKVTVNRGHIVITLDGASNMYRTVTVITEHGTIRTGRTINFRIELGVKPTKYTLKRARELFSIRRKAPERIVIFIRGNVDG